MLLLTWFMTIITMAFNAPPTIPSHGFPPGLLWINNRRLKIDKVAMITQIIYSIRSQRLHTKVTASGIPTPILSCFLVCGEYRFWGMRAC